MARQALVFITICVLLLPLSARPVVANPQSEGGCEPQWVPTFGPANAPNNWVNALLIHDDGDGPGLYVGGNFWTVGGVSMSKIARWDLIDGGWSPLGAGLITDHQYQGVIPMIVYDEGAGEGPSLFAGGGLPAYNGLAKWDGSKFTAAGPPGSSGMAHMVIFDDGTGPALYGANNGILKLSAGTWESVPGSPSYIHCMAVFDDGEGPALYVGGGFTDPAPYIAKWNGAAWSGLGEGMSNQVHALRVHDDGTGLALFVGGEFLLAGGKPAGQIAKWNAGPDGGYWSTLGDGTNLGCPISTQCLGHCGGAVWVLV